MSLSEERLELQEQKLEIERLRVELEKQRIEADLKQSSKNTFSDSLRLTTVLAAVGSLLAIAIPGSQVVTTYLNNQRELRLTQSQNIVEEDRLWRSQLLQFAANFRSDLVSADDDKWRAARAIVQTAFPTRYADPFLDKLRVARTFATNAPEPDSTRALENLLEPFVKTVDSTEGMYEDWIETRKFKHLEELANGNERARKILLDNAEFVPSDLRSDALRLIEHYNIWLERYDREVEQASKRPGKDEVFTFKTETGVPFPWRSADRFRHKLAAYRESTQSH